MLITEVYNSPLPYLKHVNITGTEGFAEYIHLFVTVILQKIVHKKIRMCKKKKRKT